MDNIGNFHVPLACSTAFLCCSVLDLFFCVKSEASSLWFTPKIKIKIVTVLVVENSHTPLLLLAAIGIRDTIGN